MNRGRVLGSNAKRPRFQRSFNEAPIHESGKGGRVATWQRRPPRFNEAPIHESGKVVQLDPLTLPGQCGFNEAPIHESGKDRAQVGRDAAVERFNEAPIHESGKAGPAGIRRRYSSALQ